MPLIPGEPAQQPPEANRDFHDPVLPVRHVEDPAVHHVLVIVGEGPVGPVVRTGGGVTRVIVRTAVEIESRRQDEGHLLPLEQGVYLAVVIEEEIAFEGGPGSGEPIHAFEFLTLRIERGYREYVLEERDARGSRRDHNCYCVLIIDSLYYSGVLYA